MSPAWYPGRWQEFVDVVLSRLAEKWERPPPDPQASLAAAAADAHATPGDSAVLVDALWRSFNHGTNFIQISTMTAITITHLMRVFIASIGYNFVIDIATKPSRPA